MELDLTNEHRLRAGVDLIPVGILNLTHEPPTFYGVERNPVETFIIPTTGREAAIGVHGELGQFAPGWSYDLVGHSGLDTPMEGPNAFLGPQWPHQCGRAPADDGAVTGRIRYTGLPGLEAAVSAQYQHPGGSRYRRDLGRRSLRLPSRWPWPARPGGALGSRRRSGGARTRERGLARARIAVGVVHRAVLPLQHRGVHPTARRTWFLCALQSVRQQRRFRNRSMVGSIYWPHPGVVFKFDVQEQFGQKPGNDDDGFNLGVGYQFY
ncbi:MAG: hypothetical protein M3461_06405 [Pseudomonadota bacterium]|nr:hypothetical protein [Pseudomonadota bacterium]